MSTEEILKQLTRIADALERISPIPTDLKTEQEKHFNYKSNNDRVQNNIELNKSILDSNKDKI